MRSLSLRSVPAMLAVGLTVLLGGCGPDNLYQGLRNPFGSICGLIVLILDIVAIVEVLNSARPTGDKVLWCAVIFFFPFVGLLAYYFFGRKA